MKIDSQNPFINKELQTAEAKKREKAEAEAKSAENKETAKGDVVRLSDRSRLVARAGELAAGAPDVREDKVNDLRERINAGTYNVSGRTVAESMLRKSITEV
jgi:flagellar biosynthesis anti-sigma factor FlgM